MPGLMEAFRLKRFWSLSNNTRVIEVEHSTFTLLVFGTNGAMGRERAKFHKLLVAKLAEKNHTKYCTLKSCNGY